MSTPEFPELPSQFDWQNVKAILADWFFKFSQQRDLVPPGALMEFAGASAPEGFVKADGAEYSTDKYPDLFKVMGSVESTPGNFVVPDATASPPAVGSIWIVKV